MNEKQTNENTQVATSQVTQDLKHSVLIVSLVLNLTVLTAWIALQVTSKYDASVATALFG
jgi:hypothetical protein